MRKILILAILLSTALLFPLAVTAQVSIPPQIIPVTTDPSGSVSCVLPWRYNTQTGVAWYPANASGSPLMCTWAQLGSGSGSGTVTVSTSSPVTVADTGFYFNNASGALTFNLPAIAAGDLGKQFCFRNYTAKTGVITLQSPASTLIDVSGATASTAGTLVSAGALGDSACVVAVTTTLYVAYIGAGTWTNN